MPLRDLKNMARLNFWLRLLCLWGGLSTTLGCAPIPVPPPTPTRFPVDEATEDSNLLLHLSMAHNTFRVDEPITVTLVLKNIGQESPLVNRRMSWYPTYEDGSVELQIVAPTGEIPIYDADINYGRFPVIQPYDFFRLHPGRAFTKTYNLSRAYGQALLPLGEYTVQALYHNEIKYSVLDVWRGELYSNIVTYTVGP